jgi:hypothetical protein
MNLTKSMRSSINSGRTSTAGASYRFMAAIA